MPWTNKKITHTFFILYHMWFLIFIGIIVACLIIRFVYDNLSLSVAMRKAGGIPVKFAELVDACLSCNGATIIQESPTFLSVGGKFIQDGITLNYAFWIQYTHGKKLIIKYVLKAPRMPQKVVKEWYFDKNTPQYNMINVLRPYINELKSNDIQAHNNNNNKIGNRFRILISRLKMEGSNNQNLFKSTIIKDTLLEYHFSIDLKFAKYIYTISFFHGTGQLQVVLSSTTFIKGQWNFTLDEDQNKMADIIERDIDKMVCNQM